MRPWSAAIDQTVKSDCRWETPMSERPFLYLFQGAPAAWHTWACTAASSTYQRGQSALENPHQELRSIIRDRCQLAGEEALARARLNHGSKGSLLEGRAQVMSKQHSQRPEARMSTRTM